MYPTHSESEDWGDAPEDFEPSYWEDYLGGPDDQQLDSSEDVDTEETESDNWEQSSEESGLDARSDGSGGICEEGGESTNREERFKTFWAAKSAAIRLRVASPTVTRDGGQFVVRYRWPQNTPLPPFRTGQQYAPEELAFIERSYADWMPIWVIADRLHRKAGAVEVRLSRVGLRHQLRPFEEGSDLSPREVTDFLCHLLYSKSRKYDSATIAARFAQLGVEIENKPDRVLQIDDLTKHQRSSLLSALLASPIYPTPEHEINLDPISDVAELAILCGAARVAARLALQCGDPGLLARALSGVGDLGKGWRKLRNRTVSYMRFALLKTFPEEFEKLQKSLYGRRVDYSISGGYLCIDHALSEMIDGDVASQPLDAQAIIHSDNLDGLAPLAKGGNKLAAWLAADLCRQRMWRDSSFPLDADREFLAVAGSYHPSIDGLMEMLRALLPFNEASAARIAGNIHLF